MHKSENDHLKHIKYFIKLVSKTQFACDLIAYKSQCVSAACVQLSGFRDGDERDAPTFL